MGRVPLTKGWSKVRSCLGGGVGLRVSHFKYCKDVGANRPSTNELSMALTRPVVERPCQGRRKDGSVIQGLKSAWRDLVLIHRIGKFTVKDWTIEHFIMGSFVLGFLKALTNFDRRHTTND